MHALAITEAGAVVSLESDLLVIRREKEVVRRVRLGEVRELLLFGAVEVTADALAGLARRGVDVVFLSPQGYFRARLVGPRSPQAALRLRQLRRALDDAFA